MLNPLNIFRRLRSVRAQAVVSPVGIWPLAPRRVSLNSSALAALEYHRRERQLDIEFRTGSVYRYFEVPPAEVRTLLSADSIGATFVERIRGEYSYKQLAGPVMPSVKEQREKQAAKTRAPKPAATKTAVKKTAAEQKQAVAKAHDLISSSSS